MRQSILDSGRVAPQNLTKPFVTDDYRTVTGPFVHSMILFKCVLHDVQV